MVTDWRHSETAERTQEDQKLGSVSNKYASSRIFTTNAYSTEEQIPRLMQRATFSQDGEASQRRAKTNIHHSDARNGAL